MQFINSLHPSVRLVYFLCVIGIAMFCANPFTVAIALIGAVAMLCCISNGKKLAFSLCGYGGLILLIAITNPLFVHEGMTVLFHLGRQPVTLEAVAYGINTGCIIVSVIIWFSLFGRVFSQEDILSVFGKRFPKIALIISMMTGFIPKLKKAYRRILHAQQGVGSVSGKKLRDRLSHSTGIFSACTAYEAENVMDISLSMKARGYGLKGRTYSDSRRFRKKDGYAVALLVVLTVIVYVYMGLGELDFWFYPKLFSKGFPAEVAFFYAVICLMPAVLEIKEKVEWKFCPAKN